jgi:hypothetical protein
MKKTMEQQVDDFRSLMSGIGNGILDIVDQMQKIRELSDSTKDEKLKTELDQIHEKIGADSIRIASNNRALWHNYVKAIKACLL